MRELLHLFPRPSRYAAIEDGACQKDPLKVKLRVGLAFPDTYEVGMSYLGQKILYGIINANPDWWAERVMAPEMEAARILAEHKKPLCTLESDTPLNRLHAIGFSITHELCYTDVVHMLDLGGIPLRARDRSQSLAECPLIIAGGGAMMGAEPLAPFLDLALLGDGEESLPQTLALLQKALANDWSRDRFLDEAGKIAGVYVPTWYVADSNGRLTALRKDHAPGRRIVADLDLTQYPIRQVLPTGAVHNRLSLEIARGCTRGCRFCHAGIVYRPARERSPKTLDSTLKACLQETGFEEVSFLALSAGDYSALKKLYLDTAALCQEEQISLALPSLRAGSVDGVIMAKMAALRRVGCTLAPEAGSQRLRNVINKGIEEEDLLEHARQLLLHGWRQVKLYFMIGLPTETDADLEEIASLCQKVRDAGGPDAPRLQVTAAISPFVPKPFTPFQWEAQICGEELERRIRLLRDLFKNKKNLTLRWHEPKVSFLEGILSRGDRRLADVVEKAYRKGAVFCAWVERFNLEPWLMAMEECGLDPQEFISGRDLDSPLPWDHLNGGVTKEFLKKERNRAYAGLVTKDCRYDGCNLCGACDLGSQKSLLPRDPADELPFRNRLVREKRDQSGNAHEDAPIKNAEQSRPNLNPRLATKAAHYRIWHKKENNFAWLSNLELQSALVRYLRRARIPVAFSQGFHPMPLISFGRALPVGVESGCEWLGLTLCEDLDPEEIFSLLASTLPEDLAATKVERVESGAKTRQSIGERFLLAFDQGHSEAESCFSKFCSQVTWPVTRIVKNRQRETDLRPFIASWTCGDKGHISFLADWSLGYISPLSLVREILAPLVAMPKIKKIAQYFADGGVHACDGRLES